ncbi:MAG TPA: AraC family transcriptional regulator [Verrucomicrobiales bacterium]|nr:AraC family transcriptional regulator [Verrucomicrobiales bacterium]
MTQEPEYFSRQVTDARRWFLSLPRPRDLGVVAVSVGCERCLPDYEVRRNDFRFQAVEMVAEGRGSLTIHGRTSILRPGSVFTYGPGVKHRIRNDGRHPMLKYFLDFGGSDAAPLMKEQGLADGVAAQVTELHELVELFELLIRSAVSNTRQSPRICSLLVELLVCKIAEQQMPPGGGDSRALATFQRAKTHIQEHFLELRSISDLAREIHVNAAYLSRLFQRFHHQSPYQYLMRLKMSRAASLLLIPGKLVKEVAAEMHFADPFHFSRTFKSVYGLSPEHFTLRRQADPPGARNDR